MTPEIKTRIEQIRRGAVPEGYIRTASGLAPAEWERYTFGDSFCFGFRLYDFSVLLPEFAAQYFRGDVFRNIANVLAQGATRYNLSKNTLLKCKLKLPPLEEQNAIAQVLSTSDRELDLLRQDIEQEKQKKKALMQLTGIVRVNI